MPPLRIGFLSTAGIGRKNWKAILNSGNAVVSAVASRDLARSRAFIAECQQQHPFAQCPAAFGSYEALLESPDVDAVYVPIPTGLRSEWVVRAAQHGKHVLCEKPCATNAAELEVMLSACREHRVQFMDGVMFMHNPRLARVREILEAGQSVGPIRRIASAFTFYSGEKFFQDNIRADGALEPTGSLGDLGWYCIRFALWTFRWQLPERVAGRILSESVALPGRVSTPAEFAGTLFYPGGVTVEFHASFRAAKQQWVHVGGRDGWLRVPDFVHPLNGYAPAFELNDTWVTVDGGVVCPPGEDAGGYGHATAQDTRMWRNFASQAASGHLNGEWPMWSLQTQKVLDACFLAARQNTEITLTP